MKILHPSWVHHDEKSIFSVDIHPNGGSFATGGQGCDSGRVAIWNLAPVVDEEAEKSNVPLMLCQMDNHLACVNCVRWSLNGQLLASGGDDKLVMIWKKTVGGGGIGAFGGGGKMVEHWRCISTLRGHAGDVLDLAWSPQDRWIASCSVDNTVIVWDAQHFPKIVHVLKGHTGLVKGVTWDPVGKFIATQSDDRSLKIWKTADWSCFKTITEPFEECGGTTHILRLSWSPDGQYLVSAHAMNGGGPTAQIIERDGWKCDKDFVGHRKAVTCVRFHNSILKRMAPKTNKQQQYCCLAIGARDRSLSIWLTALQRPLVVIHDLFGDSILDLTWSHDGYTLLACSGDGHVACLQFSAEELGTPLSEEDKNILYQRMYGKNANLDISVQVEKEMIIENADFLNVSKSNPLPPTLMPQFNANPATGVEVTAQSTSKSPGNAIGVLSSSSPSVHRPIMKQIETKTADGKRRITPMFIPLADETNGANVGTITSASLSPLTNATANKSSLTIEETPKSDSVGQLQTPTSAAIQCGKLDSRLKKITTPPPIQANRISKTSALDTISSTDVKVSEVHRVQTYSAGKAAAVAGATFKSIGELRLQVHNHTVKTTYGNLCRLMAFSLGVSKPDKKLWETVIGSSVVSFAISAKYGIVCCQDSTIRIVDIKTGTPVLPVLTLTGNVVQCSFSSNAQLAAVLTENCAVRVWNVPQKSVHLSTSCSDIMSGSNVSILHITDQGIPFIVLANGASYSYAKNLESWMLINSSDPIMRLGLITNKFGATPRNIKTYPLTTIQSYGNFPIPKNLNVADLHSSAWQPPALIAFIENQIKICETISSPQEMRYWYSMLGFQLAVNGSEEKIRQFLDGLIDSAFGFAFGATEHDGNTSILGISKHELLNDALGHLKSQTKWQRIYMEYQDQLKFLKERDCLESMAVE